jgi:hypothetical protein
MKTTTKAICNAIRFGAKELYEDEHVSTELQSMSMTLSDMCMAIQFQIDDELHDQGAPITDPEKRRKYERYASLLDELANELEYAAMDEED